MSPTGEELRESARSEKESEAKKLLRQRLREVANARGGVRAFEGPRTEKLTVTQLLDSLFADYERRKIKSLQATKNHARCVREFFGDFRAVAITPDLVRSYISHREKDGVKPATINRGLEVLSAAFSLAVKEQRLASMPHIPRMVVRNARSGFFELAEFELILQHLRAPMDDIARFGFISGWRAGEIRTLKWSNVDRSTREVRIDDSKNNDGRILACDPETWSLFEKWWDARVFNTAQGTGLSEFVFHLGNGKPISRFYACEVWQQARDAAGLPHRLFHDLRRTAIRNMVRSGVPETTAMKISGHRTRSVFDRYSIASVEDRREALQRQRDYLKTVATSSNVTTFPNSDKTRTGGQ